MNQLIKFLLILAVLSESGCATVNHQKTLSDYDKDIKKLKANLAVHPNDAPSLRDLGAIYCETRQYPLARKYLIKAIKQDPQDPKTLFYLGRVLESAKENQLALKLYKRYTRVSHQSPYRKLMEGRYHWLARELVREEMRSLLQQEQQLGVEQVSPKAIAVFPLVYEGQNQEFAPLGKGLSEMIMTDLSQVQELTLVERVRLQALMEEMALAQAGLVEVRTAPRFGKLLSAGKIVHGIYKVQNNNQVQIDVASWDVVKGRFPDFTTKTDLLKNLFQLEKDLVFSLLDNMGIKLTPQERERIQRLPTRNIQAFMAYCMGLEKEDAGQFGEAAQYYQKAIKLDPGFEMAGQKAEVSNALSLVEESKDNLLSPVDKQEKRVTGESLVNHRLQNLSTSLGANFVPGQDNRESAEEVQTSGAAVFKELPEPPRPPGRKK